MKTQTFKLSAITVLLSMALVSCGGETTEDEQNENESTNDTTVTVEEEVEEVKTQIVEDLDNATFNQYLNDKEGVLIDVRTAEEYAEGYIDGAINRDFLSGEFESSIDTLDKDKAVFVYCQSGGRSGKARDLLKNADFAEVYNLENGYGNWEE